MGGLLLFYPHYIHESHVKFQTSPVNISKVLMVARKSPMFLFQNKHPHPLRLSGQFDLKGHNTWGQDGVSSRSTRSGKKTLEEI
jgi:hypothetical protein